MRIGINDCNKTKGKRKAMGYDSRKNLFAKIEALRTHPLIAYVTSIRPNLSGQMAGDAIDYVIEQIQQIPSDQQEVDFLIISNGGDPITAIRIISILRERFKKISVLLPYVAYSAATILALGADEIIMHPYSNLGPVDPQLTFSRQSDNGQSSQLQFSSEDIRNYIDFVKSDVGIKDEDHLTSAFNALAKEVGPIPIGSAKRSQQLSLSSSIKMLETHMADKDKVMTIAKILNSSYYHHGYAVGRSEAKNIGLNIVWPDNELETLMWDVWRDYSDEMKCGSEFNLVTTIMTNPDAIAWLNTTNIINLPVNTPPQMAQNIIANMAQQFATIIPQPPIRVQELVAAIESQRDAMDVHITFSITYWRDANMALSFNATQYSEGWKKNQGDQL